MITQDIYLEKYNWVVRVFYEFDLDYYYDVVEDLIDAGCVGEELDSITEFLKNIDYNNGLTYTNEKKRISIILISRSTCAMEFQDTFDHEKGHLAMHICLSENIDPFSEEFQYLVGSIGRKMYPVAKRFMCDTCRELIK